MFKNRLYYNQSKKAKMTIRRIVIKSKPQFGNCVSHSERKVRRSYHQNRQQVVFYSEILNMDIRIFCPCSLIKTIRRFGSIDRYILRNRIIPEEFQVIKKQINKKVYKNNMSKNTEENVEVDVTVNNDDNSQDIKVETTSTS